MASIETKTDNNPNIIQINGALNIVNNLNSIVTTSMDSSVSDLKDSNVLGLRNSTIPDLKDSQPKIVKQKRVKLDRNKMTQDEKVAETKRQNEKRKILRKEEIKQENISLARRNAMKTNCLDVIKSLRQLLSYNDDSKIGKFYETMKLEPENKVEYDLDDLDASDFDSSDSEIDEDDGEDTDDEVDEEERQIFKVIPWNKNKYEKMQITIKSFDTLSSVTIDGMNASLSVVLRGIMDDTLKDISSANSDDKSIIKTYIDSKYNLEYLTILKLYCGIYQGNRPLYKFERPLKSNTDLLESVVPIEVNSIRMPMDEAQIQAVTDVTFYTILSNAKVNIFEMLNIADYYNVIGLKELLAASQALPIKKLEEEKGGLNLEKMAESLIADYTSALGKDLNDELKAKFAEFLVNCKKEIPEYTNA